MYDEIILTIPQYIRFKLGRHGWKYLIQFTSSHYPRCLSLGTCYHSTKEIVVCKALNWELRLEHERGHERGLKHTNKIGYVMNPYGFLRGVKY